MITTTKKDGSVETSFAGCVVSVAAESVQVMSDIWEMHTYALVFNNESGTFEKRFLYSDYGFSSNDEKRTAEADATDEIKVLYDCHMAVHEAKLALERAEAGRERALNEVRCPNRGKTVKVVRGRKIPRGTVGECTFYGQGKSYGFRAPAWRVGMKVNGEVVYTDARNVEVVVG